MRRRSTKVQRHRRWKQNAFSFPEIVRTPQMGAITTTMRRVITRSALAKLPPRAYKAARGVTANPDQTLKFVFRDLRLGFARGGIHEEKSSYSRNRALSAGSSAGKYGKRRQPAGDEFLRTPPA